MPGDDIREEVDRRIRLWGKVLLWCSKDSLTSWWVDDEIGKAFQKEQPLMTARKKKILALIPLNLDGFRVDEWENGKGSQMKARLAPDFRKWKESHAKCEDQMELVVGALPAGEQTREAPESLF